MVSQQALEKPCGCCTITLCLKIHINHFSILVHGSPQVMLLAVDLHKDFIDEARRAIFEKRQPEFTGN